ncbi:MAG: dihydroorotate dehydrogenase [Euryarchaeota archaeon]|nr:dihydroorotate dehydrogenase [Euryarchaeota archaeon]
MLATRVSTIQLQNPTILASGVLGSYGSSIRRVAEKGAAALVTKSLGVEARTGHNNPTVVELEGALINAMGLPNPGYKAFGDEITAAKAGGRPIIGSAYGFSVEEYVEVARGLEGYGVDAVELNLSCPNVADTGTEFGQDPELCSEVVRAVKGAVKIPVFAKLTAEVGDIVEIAKACEEAKADGVTAINTLRAMKIDVRVRTPALGNRTGGLSGPYIKPVAVRCVYEIAQETDLDIIGCGGISTGEDIAEFLMAGAKAVEIGTGVWLRGIGVFKKASEELERFMQDYKYSSIEELVGAAL